MTSEKKSLFDILSEDYRSGFREDEQRLHSAAQLTPVRGMTQAHIDQISDWLEQNNIGKLVPAKAQGKVLFVPREHHEDFHDMEHAVNAMFKALHSKYLMDPFHQQNWLLKTVPA